MARFYKATIYPTNWVGRPRTDDDKRLIGLVASRALLKHYKMAQDDNGSRVIRGSKSAQSLCNLFKGTGSTFHLSSYGIGPCDVLIELDREYVEPLKLSGKMVTIPMCRPHRSTSHTTAGMCEAYDAGLYADEA